MGIGKGLLYRKMPLLISMLGLVTNVLIRGNDSLEDMESEHYVIKKRHCSRQ
jgi:hypothetical protein